MTTPDGTPPPEPNYGTTPPPQGPPPGGYVPPAGGYVPPPAPGYPPAPGAPGGFGPPPPGGAYPGFPPAQPPKKKRKKWPIIVGSVVVLLIVVGVISVLTGRKGSGDPHTAANNFWSAMAKHDSKKAQKYLCPDHKVKSDTKADFEKLVAGVQSYTIGAETGTGKKRVYPVSVTLTEDGQTGTLTFSTDVEKQSGEWYVCTISTS